MHSAFTARPIVELRPRDKSKIETILAYGDRVLVGLNSGALRVYRLNDHQNGQAPDQPQASQSPPDVTNEQANGQPSDRPTDLLREVERFSTRAVEQLAIIKEADTLVSLSNYHISLYDCKSYNLVETLSKTKNASCFAVTSNIVKDTDTGIPEIISRLAVAVKRRLLLWSWHASELNEEVEEITLSESIRTITWASATKLVCGMNGGYVVVDVTSKDVSEIVSPGSVGIGNPGSRFGAVSSAGMGYMGLGGYTPKPLAAKLADGEMLLAKDINTLFVDDQGKPLDRKQIPWQSAPESIGYSYPYILALQTPAKGSLEVRNPKSLSLLQTIPLPGAAQLHFPPPTVSLAHAGRGFHISSDRCVWKMDATDYDSQVDELVQSGNFDEALSVLDMLEDALLRNKTQTMREVRMLKAEMLFTKKRFRPSMDLFNESEAPPERVLKLFPTRISGSTSGWAQNDEDEYLEKHGQKSHESTNHHSSNGTDDTGSSLNAGGIARFIGFGHKKTPSDVASVLSKKDSAETEDSESVKEAAAGEERPLDGPDLKKAVLELNSYLAGTRARLQRVIDPVTGKLKPQATNGSLEDAMENFLRTTQTSSEKEQEDKLKETFRLVDTALFRAYMFSQPSLAGSLFRIPNFCDPEVVNDKLLEHNRYTELVDFFHGKKLHQEALDLLKRFGTAKKPDAAAPTLHGPDRAIQYLESLPPSEIDLILEHAGWVLDANAEYAMEIFTGETENAETLPRDRVLAFLRDKDVALERVYLEHIIDELDDLEPQDHNRLVELYLQSLQNQSRGDAWDDLMQKFLAFLRDPKHVYSMSKALGMLPKDDEAFYEATAVVLSNMGQHKQALKILVFKMGDYVKAEEYCNRVHKSQEAEASAVPETDDSDAPPSIYHTLLSLYLQPPSPNEILLDPALDLLSKHGPRLSAESTLSLLPADLPISSLFSYFRSRIRAANSLVNETRIISHLRTAEGISVAARLHLGDGTEGGQGGRNRHVVVGEDRACIACHKKLGGNVRVGGSVLAVLPDNVVVHYGCLGRVAGSAGKGFEATAAPSWGRGF